MHSRLPRGVRPRLEGKPRTPLSSRVATRVSWSPLSGLKVELCVEPAGRCGRCTGVAVPLRVVPSPTGPPHPRLQAPVSPKLSVRGCRKPRARGPRPGVSGDLWGSQEGCQGPFRPSGRNRGCSPRDSQESSPTPQFKSINSSPSRPRRGIASPVAIRRGEGAQEDKGLLCFPSYSFLRLLE